MLVVSYNYDSIGDCGDNNNGHSNSNSDNSGTGNAQFTVKFHSWICPVELNNMKWDKYTHKE